MQDKKKAFVDSNIFLYLYSEDEKTKQDIAEKIITTGQPIVSTQVINEISNVLHKKFHKSFSTIQQILEELLPYITVKPVDLSTIQNAFTLADKYKYAYFDSLILSSALEQHCEVLYSEDMRDQQIIEKKIKIINPFKGK